MTYPDPGYHGEESEIGTRYRAGSFSRFPLASHQMRERYTRTQDLIVLCHLGVPELEIDSWSLTIDGLIARPCNLSFSELTAYPKRYCTSFHQCMGSPLRPFEPTRRICNVRWGGCVAPRHYARVRAGSGGEIRMVIWRGLRRVRRRVPPSLRQGSAARTCAIRRVDSL
jgi:DMSO/TMAO reductase YedYZ molybdopterin-dependent catalytic subunit